MLRRDADLAERGGPEHWCEPLGPSTVKAVLSSGDAKPDRAVGCQSALPAPPPRTDLMLLVRFRRGALNWESESGTRKASWLSNTHYSAPTTQRVTTDYCIHSDTTCFQSRNVSNTCFNAGRKHLTFYWRQKTWVKHAYITQDIKLTNYIPYYSLFL